MGDRLFGCTDIKSQSVQQDLQSSSAGNPPENAKKDEELEHGDPGKAGVVRDAPPSYGDSGGPNDISEKENENEWKIALSQAASQAKSMGDFPASLERLVNRILNPKLDWRDLLDRFYQYLGQQ